MAHEIRYILFDMFGGHLENLFHFDVKDIKAGDEKLSGTWLDKGDEIITKQIVTIESELGLLKEE
ncbi:MAG: hypothetical protein GY801_22040 [bacterium]|nr:hypothetical protein [bacterium]